MDMLTCQLVAAALSRNMFAADPDINTVVAQGGWRSFAIGLMAVAVLCGASRDVVAKEYSEYGRYDLHNALTTKTAGSGKQAYRVDVKLIDRVVDDLAAHAKDYPPQFRGQEEKSRAERDAKTLAAIFDKLTADKGASAELLLKAAFVDGIAHNLDIPGAAEKAAQNYDRVLTRTPENPQANLNFGIFLAGVGKQKESLPYLEKALKLGLDDAKYTLGLVYMALGDKEKAIEFLEGYGKTHPQDPRPEVLIGAIKSGRVRVEQHRNSAER
jgi:tetratricopeptide (TPR) repeat protein